MKVLKIQFEALHYCKMILKSFKKSKLLLIYGIIKDKKHKYRKSYERECITWFMGTSDVSLRSRLFRFLLAGESESQGEVARTHGARAKRGTGECHLCPRALAQLSLAWKETEKTATQARVMFLKFSKLHESYVGVCNLRTLKHHEWP